MIIDNGDELCADEVILTANEWGELASYDFSTPTDPSPGRIWRCQHMVVFTQASDEPGMIDICSRRPVIRGHDEPTHIIDGHYFSPAPKEKL